MPKMHFSSSPREELGRMSLSSRVWIANTSVAKDKSNQESFFFLLRSVSGKTRLTAKETLLDEELDLNELLGSKLSESRAEVCN